jgi:N-acetyl sugar amidotransferase
MISLPLNAFKTDAEKVNMNTNTDNMNKEYQVCSSCIMDTSVPDISFDQNGVCNFCKQYHNQISKDLYQDEEGQARLEKLVSKIKKRGEKREYDCLIGISGGVDSSYVAYLVKKKYGLRPLALHLDNGWNTELSVANVEQIVKRLDIDLYTYVLDWEVFKDLQISFLKSSITNIEIPTDHAIWAALIRTAAEKKIPYIIAGNNIVTEAIMPDSWLYSSKDSRLITGLQRQFGQHTLKTYPKLSTFNYIDYLLIRGIRWIPILNYVPYVKQEAKKILIDELGWRDYGGKHYESIFTRFFHAYYLPEKFGYDLRRTYLSALVLSGQMDRQEALKEIAEPPAPAQQLREDKEYVVKKLGLSKDEFEEIMNAPPRLFSDYPNNDSLWRKLYWFVRIARQWIIRVK